MKAKQSITTIAAIMAISCTGINLANPNHDVSALTYQTKINNNFTISPSVSISLSSADLIIDDLAPGSSSDSNIITLNVSTNNLTGYNLNTTVGNSTHANRDLNHASDNNVSFSSLDYGSSIADLSTYDTSSLPNPNVWGYSYSLDHGTTWSSYSGLPLYNDATNIATLQEKYGPSDESIDFKIAAKTSPDQIAGEYNNVINFTVTTFPSPMSLVDSYAYFNKQQINDHYTMQDMEPGICALAERGSELQVIDARDNNIYTVAKLKDDRCWMLDNLRLDPVMTELSGLDTNAPQDALELYQNGGTATEPGWSGVKVTDVTASIYSYTEPKIHSALKDEVSTDALDAANGWKIGVHYNYCAVSAGTYCYSSDSGSGDAEYDICPINWRLPTGGSTGEYATLYNIDDYNSYIAYRNALHLPLSGYFGAAANDQGRYNSSWTSTHYDDSTSQMYRMMASGVGHLIIIQDDVRRVGIAARCIVKQ